LVLDKHQPSPEDRCRNSTNKRDGGMTLGQLIRREREVRGWSRSRLGVKLGEIGDPPTTYGDTKIGALEKDLVRYISPDLVRRLIEVLELDPVAAWRAAYPEVAEALLTAVGGARPARAPGAGGPAPQPASDLGRAPSRCKVVSTARTPAALPTQAAA